jgi:hypothetical protein
MTNPPIPQDVQARGQEDSPHPQAPRISRPLFRKGKRCQEPLFGDSLQGRPRGRKADSRSNRFVIRSIRPIQQVIHQTPAVVLKVAITVPDTFSLPDDRRGARAASSPLK